MFNKKKTMVTNSLIDENNLTADEQDKQHREFKLKVENDLRKYKVYLLGMIISFVTTVIFFGFVNTYKVYSVESVIGDNNKLVIENVCLLGTRSILREKTSGLLFTNDLKNIINRDGGFLIDEPKVISVKKVKEDTCRVIIKDAEKMRLKSYVFTLVKNADYEFDYKINQIDEKYYSTEEEI